MTAHEHAKAQFGVGVGTTVEFEFEGRRLVGRVNRVHRRATVLVEDADGMRYSDGKRYAKFYVPLAWLRASPAPFGYDVLSRYVAGRMNLPVVEFEQAGRYDFAIDVAKAHGVLGCPLKQDIFTIVEEAISLRGSSADANASPGPAPAPGAAGGST